MLFRIVVEIEEMLTKKKNIVESYLRGKISPSLLNNS